MVGEVWMRSRKCASHVGVSVVLCLCAARLIAVAESPRPGIDWPQFRGIASAGIAEGFPLPVRWNMDPGENVRWKASIPGLSHSSPVVWRDLVCVTTAVTSAAGKSEDLKVGLYGDIEPVNDQTPLSWEVHCFDKGT